MGLVVYTCRTLWEAELRKFKTSVGNSETLSPYLKKNEKGTPRINSVPCTLIN